jgi:hypothetical protein
VQQFPVDPTQESAVAELFFGDSFFDMLCQETNRYYLQHREQRRHGQVKKPICISEYNMFMKGVDRADQYLAYYSLPWKTVKWMKKVALWLINCAIFNSFSVFKKLNPSSKYKYKAFLLNVAKAWATDGCFDRTCKG